MTAATAGGEAREHLASYLEMLEAERGASQNTIDAYRRDIEDFLAFLDRQSLAIADIERRHIASYLEGLGRDGLSAASRARRLSALRQFSKFLVASEVIDVDAFELVRGPKKARALPKILSIASGYRCLGIFFFHPSSLRPHPLQNSPK